MLLGLQSASRVWPCFTRLANRACRKSAPGAGQTSFIFSLTVLSLRVALRHIEVHLLTGEARSSYHHVVANAKALKLPLPKSAANWHRHAVAATPPLGTSVVAEKKGDAKEIKSGLGTGTAVPPLRFAFSALSDSGIAAVGAMLGRIQIDGKTPVWLQLNNCSHIGMETWQGVSNMVGSYRPLTRKAVQALRMTSCFRTAEAFTAFRDGLMHFSSLTALDLPQVASFFSHEFFLRLGAAMPHLLSLGLYDAPNSSMVARSSDRGFLLGAAEPWPFPKLMHLNISRGPFTGVEVCAVLRTCSALTSLDVSVLRHLHSYAVPVSFACTGLRELNLEGCEKLDASFLDPLLRVCPMMERLNLADFELLSDARVGVIASLCPRLRTLNLHGSTQITDQALFALAKTCPQLTELDVSECIGVTDAGIIALAKACPLESLVVAELHLVTDKSMAELASRCRALAQLSVAASSGVTDASIVPLVAACPSLEWLDVRHCAGITDASVLAVAKHCKQLRRLSLSGCMRITDAGADALRAAEFKLLSELNPPASLTVEAVQLLKNTYPDALHDVRIVPRRERRHRDGDSRGRSGSADS